MLAGSPQLTLLTTLMSECRLEGLRRLQCMEGLVPLWEDGVVERLTDLRCLLLTSCGLATLPPGMKRTSDYRHTASHLAQPFMHCAQNLNLQASSVCIVWLPLDFRKTIELPEGSKLSQRYESCEAFGC